MRQHPEGASGVHWSALLAGALLTAAFQIVWLAMGSALGQTFGREGGGPVAWLYGSAGMLLAFFIGGFFSFRVARGSVSPLQQGLTQWALVSVMLAALAFLSSGGGFFAEVEEMDPKLIGKFDISERLIVARIETKADQAGKQGTDAISQAGREIQEGIKAVSAGKSGRAARETRGKATLESWLIAGLLLGTGLSSVLGTKASQRLTARRP